MGQRNRNKSKDYGFTQKEISEIICIYQTEIEVLRMIGRRYLGRENEPENYRPMLQIFNQLKRYQYDLEIWKSLKPY